MDPYTVAQILDSPGQPLDPVISNFMERRFGHDFSQVRVHNDAKAAEVARQLNARAFSARRDVFFGRDQYSPYTEDGKRLLAHELTHIVQKEGKISGAANRLMRSPETKRSKRRTKYDLRVLANYPSEAIPVWRKLSGDEKREVQRLMAKLYGDAFVRSFLEYASRSRKPDLGQVSYTAGVRYDQMARFTRMYEARGYKRGPSKRYYPDLLIQDYVHPSGKYITVTYDITHPTTPSPKRPPPMGEEAALAEANLILQDYKDEKYNLQTRADKLKDILSSPPPYQVDLADLLAKFYAESDKFKKEFEDILDTRIPDLWNEIRSDEGRLEMFGIIGALGDFYHFDPYDLLPH